MNTLPDMPRDSLRGFAHLGLLVTLLQSFPKSEPEGMRSIAAKGSSVRIPGAVAGAPGSFAFQRPFAPPP